MEIRDISGMCILTMGRRFTVANEGQHMDLVMCSAFALILFFYPSGLHLFLYERIMLNAEVSLGGATATRVWNP
jgi:hypothetical protein